jgi:hypothetical protein
MPPLMFQVLNHARADPLHSFFAGVGGKYDLRVDQVGGRITRIDSSLTGLSLPFSAPSQACCSSSQVL